MFNLKVDLEKMYIQNMGSVADMAADILVVIRSQYAGLINRDKHLAEAFRQMIVAGVTHDDAPVFVQDGVFDAVTIIANLSEEGRKL